jgi:hypothetical protein
MVKGIILIKEHGEHEEREKILKKLECLKGNAYEGVLIEEIFSVFGWPDFAMLVESSNVSLIKAAIIKIKEMVKSEGCLDTTTLIGVTTEELQMDCENRDKREKYTSTEHTVWYLKKKIKEFQEILKNLCLFNWNDVPGNDSERLIYHLVTTLKIDWAKDAEIKKSDDGKTITVTNGDHSLELELNENEGKVILKTNSEKLREYIVKKENNRLNIHELIN